MKEPLYLVGAIFRFDANFKKIRSIIHVNTKYVEPVGKQYGEDGLLDHITLEVPSELLIIDIDRLSDGNMIITVSKADEDHIGLCRQYTKERFSIT